MKRICPFIFLLTGFYTFTQAQYTRHIVQLTDKNGTPHTLSDPSTYLSPKAIARRARQHILIDLTDLPIAPAYLDSIRNVPNVTVYSTSKWLNQVLVITSDAAALDRINSFPFVKTTASVAPRRRPGTEEPVNEKFREVVVPVAGRSEISQANGINTIQGTAGIASLNYGESYAQVHIHEGEYLHNKGYTGEGITIAMLDAGFFGYTTNAAIDSVRLQGRILGAWDFVANEASVEEDHTHGLFCFSIIAANKPGEIVGSAPHASFWLLRTEDAGSEYPVEEQYWIAGAEFADSAGADMISSSLGYANFNDPAFNHTYTQRNGNTAMITIAADLAVKKGMIVTNSAGNSGGVGDEGKYVLCPADGDSVLAVGATDPNGNIAGFSSWGPNSAGKIKPNVVSVGQGTILAATNGNAASGNGTSFSNPNMCGLVACLWQAFPEFTNMEVIDAVQKSASRYNNPDERYGYGIPNFRKAYESLFQLQQARRMDSLLTENIMRAFPVPFSNDFTLAVKAPHTGKASIQLIDAMGRIIDKKELQLTAGQVYIINFNKSPTLLRGVYYIRYQDGNTRHTIAVTKQ